jgi:hypothetical protein
MRALVFTRERVFKEKRSRIGEFEMTTSWKDSLVSAALSIPIKLMTTKSAVRLKRARASADPLDKKDEVNWQ